MPVYKASDFVDNRTGLLFELSYESRPGNIFVVKKFLQYFTIPNIDSIIEKIKEKPTVLFDLKTSAMIIRFLYDVQQKMRQLTDIIKGK